MPVTQIYHTLLSFSHLHTVISNICTRLDMAPVTTTCSTNNTSSFDFFWFNRAMYPKVQTSGQVPQGWTGTFYTLLHRMAQSTVLNDYSPLHTSDKVEFNTVDFVESRLLTKWATKWTVANRVNFVADTVDFVAGFGNKSATAWIQQLVAWLCCWYGHLRRQCVWGQSDTADFVNFQFVASVYRA